MNRGIYWFQMITSICPDSQGQYIVHYDFDMFIARDRPNVRPKKYVIFLKFLWWGSKFINFERTVKWAIRIRLKSRFHRSIATGLSYHLVELRDKTAHYFWIYGRVVMISQYAKIRSKSKKASICRTFDKNKFVWFFRF